MKYINEINKSNKKEGVILLGRGKSIDNLKMDCLNKQKKYDICTIADAMKIIDHPKFAFHYHWASARRSYEHLGKAENLVINEKVYNDMILKRVFENHGENINKLVNIRVFKSKHIKLHHIQNQQFDILVDNTLFNYCGSVVGVVNFLLGYMEYKNIYFIGFDGGLTYGDTLYSADVCHGRKSTKIKGCENKYFESWKGTIALSKFYPNQKLLPLQEFLK